MKKLKYALYLVSCQVLSLAYAQEPQVTKPRTNAFIDASIHLCNNDDEKGFSLLMNYAACLGRDGELDILALVSTRGIPANEARPAFDFLLRSQDKEIVAASISFLGYDYSTICNKKEIEAITRLSTDADPKVRSEALLALKQIRKNH